MDHDFKLVPSRSFDRRENGDCSPFIFDRRKKIIKRIIIILFNITFLNIDFASFRQKQLHPLILFFFYQNEERRLEHFSKRN